MKTVDELLAAWDRGDSIFSIEMGGLGPGYEQAIQITAVEFARATRGFEQTDDKKADYERFDVLCTKALKKFDDEIGGITGAMFGAAKHIAWHWVCEGPEAMLEKARENGIEDRIIQVSKSWPKAPEPMT